MRKKYLFFYLYLAVLLTVFSGRAGFFFGEGPVKLMPKASAEKTTLPAAGQGREKIRAYLAKRHINGSVAILKDGNIFFNEGTGYADLRTKKPNQRETTFPIASITKTLVAVSILQLQEEGKLSLQDPAAKYIHGPSNGNQINIRHLLTHTSGIQEAGRREKDSPQDLIVKAGKQEAKFPAGTKWDYNDMNYMILGYIIEKVTGKPLHAYIENHIFKKAGMKHSGFIAEGKGNSFSSEGYIKTANGYAPASKLDPVKLFGCGDIYATALDVTHFDDALINGRLLDGKSLKAMLTPATSSNYGLGLYNNGERIYSRGVTGGWESFHAYYPDRTVIVILENIRNKQQSIEETADDLHDLVKVSLKSS